MNESGGLAFTLTREELERTAGELVQLFRSFFSLLNPGDDPKIVVQILSRALEDPEGLKNALVDAALNEDPQQIGQDIERAADLIRSPRKLLIPFMKQALPPGARGVQPRITESKEHAMELMAKDLLPAAEKLLELRATKTKRAVRTALSISRQILEDHRQSF